MTDFSPRRRVLHEVKVKFKCHRKTFYVMITNLSPAS